MHQLRPCSGSLNVRSRVTKGHESRDTLEDIQFQQCFHLNRLGRALRFIFSHPEFAINSILTPVIHLVSEYWYVRKNETNQEEAYHPTTNDFPFSSGARAQRVTPPNDAEMHLHDLSRPNVVRDTLFSYLTI